MLRAIVPRGWAARSAVLSARHHNISSAAFSSPSASTPERTIPPPAAAAAEPLHQDYHHQQQQQRKPAKRRGPYFVARTASGNLAVYHELKRGGNLHLTVVKKIEGDERTLSGELRDALDLDDGHVKINPQTKHIVIKGLYMARVKEWLTQRGF